MIKGGELTIKKDDVPDGGSLKICEELNYTKKKFKIEGGTTKYEDNTKPEKSKVCVEMTKDKPSAPTGLCFRDGVIDATKDKGNNAIWSYVRNASRNGVEFPALSNSRNDNSNLNSDLRETEVVGGNHGVSDSRVFIFARPHDGIQFRHVFCFGAQAVESLPFDKAKSNPGSSRYRNTPSSTFNIATGPDNRLYGSSITSSQISFKSREHGSDIDVTGASNPVSETSEWGRAYDEKVESRIKFSRLTPATPFLRSLQLVKILRLGLVAAPSVLLNSIKDSISAAINDDAASGDSACGKQLRINGPVFVGSQVNRGKLHLLRHAGAYPGNKATGGDRGNFTDPVLNADGSVTPAEIFNLRLDAYLWAYSQAERLTQAFVTYSRELPPRY